MNELTENKQINSKKNINLRDFLSKTHEDLVDGYSFLLNTNQTSINSFGKFNFNESAGIPFEQAIRAGIVEFDE